MMCIAEEKQVRWTYAIPTRSLRCMNKTPDSAITIMPVQRFRGDDFRIQNNVVVERKQTILVQGIRDPVSGNSMLTMEHCAPRISRPPEHRWSASDVA